MLATAKFLIFRYFSFSLNALLVFRVNFLDSQNSVVFVFSQSRHFKTAQLGIFLSLLFIFKSQIILNNKPLVEKVAFYTTCPIEDSQ